MKGMIDLKTLNIPELAYIIVVRVELRIAISSDTNVLQDVIDICKRENLEYKIIFKH